MITRYRDFLSFLDKKLQKMFENEKTFIKCKKGCAYCCKEGEYPLSELEYIYLMLAYENLEEEIKLIIKDKIYKLLKFSRKKLYECPFLIKDQCSVYSARPLICRTFGLITQEKNGKQKVPFCIDLGLNYSNMDTVSEQPKAYNISRNVLRSNKVEKEYNLFFGDDKTLIDWLNEDFRGK